MAYAEPSDLATFLREDFDSDDEARAKDLLKQASGEIDAELEQNLDQVQDDQVTLDGPGTELLVLPHWPVTGLSLVEEDGDELTEGDDYRWSEVGLVRRVDDDWTGKPRAITVTYTHGYETVPEVVRSAAVQIAASWWSNPRQMQSETFGDYSYRVSSSRSAVETQLARVRRFAAGLRAR